MPTTIGQVPMVRTQEISVRLGARRGPRWSSRRRGHRRAVALRADPAGPQAPGRPRRRIRRGQLAARRLASLLRRARPSTRCCRGPAAPSALDAVVARLTEQGGPSDLRAGIADSDGDFQHPTYWSTAGRPRLHDPLHAALRTLRDRGHAGADPRPRAAGRRLGRPPHRGGPAQRLGVRPLGGGVEAERRRRARDRLRRAHPHRRRRPRLGRHGRPLRHPRRDHPAPRSCGAAASTTRCSWWRTATRASSSTRPAGAGAPCEDRTDAPGGGHALPARHVGGRDPRARSAPLEAGHPAGPGALRDVRRATPADPRGTSSSSPARPTRASATRTRSSRYAKRLGIPRRPTAATTSTWTRGSTGGAACG